MIAPPKDVTARVLSFVPPSLRIFESEPTFNAFIDGLEECIARNVGVAEASQVWKRNAANVARDRELDQFCAFLKRIQWTRKIESIPTESSLTEDGAKQLAAALAKLTPKPLVPSDPCYWFPAGRHVNASLQKAFDATNPIPIICENLESVFSSADRLVDPPPRAMNRTPAVDQVLGCLCNWIALGQNDQTKDAVRASLQLCCDLPAVYREQSLEPGDVKALMISLRTPDSLRELAIERWHRDLDFESDDRLLQGFDLLSRLSLTKRVPLDAKLKKALKGANVRFDGDTGPMIPISVVGTMISVLYCRWLGQSDNDVPTFVDRLPRLFNELTYLGRVKNEGRAPFTSSEGYSIANTLRAIRACCPQMLGSLNPDDCEFVVLARALRRHSSLEPDYFDVGEYVPKPDSACWEDISNYFVEYKAFASAAERIGLRRLAAAAWSFFLVSVTVAFHGRLKVSWSDLEPELTRSLTGPGGHVLLPAVEIAADLAEQSKETVNALRLRELVVNRRRNRRESGSHSRRRRRAPLIQLLPNNPRIDANTRLERFVGPKGWARLAQDTRDHFIDGWLASGAIRRHPVNPDFSGWGPLSMHFLEGLESELVTRVEAIEPEIITDYYVSQSSRARRRFGKWTFKQTVNLLRDYARFPPRMQKAMRAVGLERVCENNEYLEKLGRLAALRNQAAHGGNPFTESEHLEILVLLFTQKFLSDFSEALAPSSG